MKPQMNADKRRLRVLALSMFICLDLWPQQATFQTTTRLVVETVAVKDKNGKAIEGLTAEDFVVTEDGVRQDIRFFEFQTLPETPDTAPIMTSSAPAPFP